MKLIFLLLCLTGCTTLQPHLYDIDSVYRVGPKGGKIDAAFWNGEDWERAGKVSVPAGTYFMSRVN